jgi:predicted PurR-regulated permease PerM
MLPAMAEETEVAARVDPSPPAARRAAPYVAPVVVPRWVQLVLLPLSIIALYIVARAAGTVLIIFVVAAVIALILNPVVSFVQRGSIPRSLAVIAVYVAFFTTLVGAGFLLAGPVTEQTRSFQRDVPDLVDGANDSLHDLQVFFDDNGIDVEIERQGETALTTLQSKALEGSGEIVSITGEILTRLVETGFHILLVVVLSIYMLIYGPMIGAIVRRVMPPGDGTASDDFPALAQRAVYNYVRGQLVFSVLMGASAGLLMWVYGALGIFEDGGRYALAFGAWFGLMELVPYVGPVLGAIPPIVVAAFEDPLTAVWVGLGFLALQQLEGHVVAPQVFGRTLRLNPLIVLFALLLGGEMAGFVGAILALPIAAVVRETVVYLRRHLVLEPWGRATLAIDGPPPDPLGEETEPR